MIPAVFYYTVFSMLRVLLVILAVALIWILFFSDFEKRKRLVFACALFFVSVFAMWFDSYLSNPRSDKIALDSVAVCGLDVAYSYRTNYEVKLCVENQASDATLRRVAFEVSAQVCDETDECASLQTVSKSRSVSVQPGANVTLIDSMAFDMVVEYSLPLGSRIDWKVDIVGVKGS